MEDRAVGKVVRSNLPPNQAGYPVLAGTGWQEFSLSDGSGVQKIDPSLRPLSHAQVFKILFFCLSGANGG